MLGHLWFIFQELKHPYLQEPPRTERWGRFKIEVLINDDSVCLLDTQWNLNELIDWLTINENAIRNISLSEHMKEQFTDSRGGLAQTILILQEKEFINEEEEDRWFDKLFEFRKTHSLRFALRGSKIPEIIIAPRLLNSMSVGEISKASDSQSSGWSYFFDMDEFWRNLKPTLEEFKADDSQNRILKS